LRSIEDFKEEVKDHYTGNFKEITIDREPTPFSTGNGISYRSIYTIVVCLNQKQDAQDLEYFRACLKSCQAWEQGSYFRTPESKTILNSIDDHFYAAAASFMIECDRSIARSILQYGRDHEFHWNCINPGVQSISSWLGRFFWFRSFLKLCASEPLQIVDAIELAASLAILPASDDASGLMMAWVRARLMKSRGFFCALAANRFFRKLNEMHPGGISDVCTMYFNKPGAIAHPFSWREIWQNI
jgi:hypothetical protein